MTSPNRLSARYREVLSDHLGVEVVPDALPDGSIALEHLGLRMVLANHAPVDPEFIRVLCHVEIDPDVYHDDLDTVAQSLTRDYKAVKADRHPGGLLISAESVVAAPGHLPSTYQLAMVLPRLLTAIRLAVSDLSTRLTFHALTRDLEEPTEQH